MCVVDVIKIVGYKCNCVLGFIGDKCESKLLYEIRIK